MLQPGDEVEVISFSRKKCPMVKAAKIYNHAFVVKTRPQFGDVLVSFGHLGKFYAQERELAKIAPK